MRITDYTLYNGAAVAASEATSAIEMEQSIGLSVQTVYTSTTASFVLTLQVSNDGTTYIDTAQTLTITNTSGAVMLTLVDFMHKYARVNIVRTSGTLTTLTLKVIAKGL